MTSKSEPIFSSKEVAERLHVSKSTLHELVKRGDIGAYRVGRNLRFSEEDVEDYLNRAKNRRNSVIKKVFAEKNMVISESRINEEMIIGGQDLILDVLSSYLRLNGAPALRIYAGSFECLLALYQGTIQVASAHLWDAVSDSYNLPFVRYLLPGIPTTVIHLVNRVQGLYVAKGNPKGINSWADLARDDVTVINREKGSGSRVLLDGHLSRLSIDTDKINGYENETASHLTVASAVSSGLADVGVGMAKIARQVQNIDFIPMQTESYDLVVRTAYMESDACQKMLAILRSESFQREFSSVGDYDTCDMGTIRTL